MWYLPQLFWRFYLKSIVYKPTPAHMEHLNNNFTKKKKRKKNRKRWPWNCILFFTIVIPDRSIIFSDKTDIYQHSLKLRTLQNIFAREFTLDNDHWAIVNLLNKPKSKVILQKMCMNVSLQDSHFTFEIR